LVAYIVPEGDRTPSVSELRQHLMEKLPDYMVPSAFVVLEKFPLSPNGKIDRKALPVPETVRPQIESSYVAPQTEIERTITAAWQAALHLEKIGVNDNFFDLGGHSLRMAQVHVKLRETLKPDLSMLELFKFPTITSLAQYLSQGKSGQIPSEMTDGQIERMKEGKSRLKQRLRQREQAGQKERNIQDA